MRELKGGKGEGEGKGGVSTLMLLPLQSLSQKNHEAGGGDDADFEG